MQLVAPTLASAAGTAGDSRTLRTAPRTTASSRIWGLDWSRELPWTIDGVGIELGSFDDALPFMEEHYASIFGADATERFFVEPMTEAKRRFCDDMDVFVFRAEARTVGVCTAHPTDWSTYYIRTFALLPELRERGVATGFEARLCEPLRAAGVNRYEAECSVANRPMIRLFTSQGFLITSTATSERWGAVLRFTKHLDDGAASAFRRSFVQTSAFGRNPSTATAAETRGERRKT
jgi:RimJ/RimL family protein N-acetyltransferase